MSQSFQNQIIHNYINGELVAPVSKQYFDNYCPATGKVYSQIPNSNSQDIENAVQAAQNARLQWSKTSAAARSKILLKIAQHIENETDMLAHAESYDNGKPVWLAQTVDIPRAAANLRFFATAILHTQTQTFQTPPNILNYTITKPLGTVACISPWNLPLYLFTWKIAPALAAGNCVVAKPSEITPFTAFLFSKIAQKYLPPGVLNIVHGYGHTAGQALIQHPNIKAISFTGGTETGKKIAQTAALSFKKTSLELGGKNACIIYADCDYKHALQTAITSAFRNQGQICLCNSRIFIERPIYEQFKKDFVQLAQQLTTGDPTQKVDLGAIVSKQHFDKILNFIQLAQQEGGNLLTGGTPITLPSKEYAEGWFLPPTVFENLPYNCRTNQEEIFGPVVTLTPFDTTEQVLQYANSTQYGLVATIFSNNINTAHNLAHQLQTGMVWINCWMQRDLRTPFGGVKNSGMGREGGEEALRFFTETQNIGIQLL